MGSRVPVQQQHYTNLRPATSFIGTSLNNEDDDRHAAAEVVTEESLNDDVSNGVDGLNEAYRNTIALHNIDSEEDRCTLENSESSRGAYDILTTADISPIESARQRFLQIIVDYFIVNHLVEVADSETDYSAQPVPEKHDKRKSGDIQYEGDPRYALPLMYVANLYETLVNDANIRIASLNGIREKTIGVALEAAGGLYRRLAKKFPKKGPCFYKRRELATSLETRTRFPELVIHEEKRVRFVVVNGLDIVEKPDNVDSDDAEWFKRLTGRSEVAISARDYKFYSPRHKYRRIASNSLPSGPSLPEFPGADSSVSSGQGYRSITDPQTQQSASSKHHISPVAHHTQLQPIQQNYHPSIHQSEHGGHFSHDHQCGPTSHLQEITHAHQSPPFSQNITCFQPLAGAHVGGHLPMMPSSPAKFCYECGAPYLRETSKFCSECGTRRLGI